MYTLTQMGYLSNIENDKFVNYDFTIGSNKMPVVLEKLAPLGIYFYIRHNEYYITIDSINIIFTLEPKTLFYTCQNGFICSNNKVLSWFGNILNIRERYDQEDENNLKDQIIYNEFRNLLEKFYGDGKIIVKNNKKVDTIKQYLLKSPHNQISNAFEIPEASQLLFNSDLINILNTVWGERNWHLTTFSSTRLLPNTPEGKWHVDYPYTSIGVSRPEGIQVIIPIDNFTSSNGATEYIETTHLFQNNFVSEGFLEKKKQLIIEVGNTLIMLGNVVHRSGANNSNLPRCALLANFSPLGIPPKDVFEFVREPFKFVNGNVQT